MYSSKKKKNGFILVIYILHSNCYFLEVISSNPFEIWKILIENQLLTIGKVIFIEITPFKIVQKCCLDTKTAIKITGKLQ